MQIFHGEDIKQSRAAFIEAKDKIKKNGGELNEFAGDVITTSDIKTALQSISLLGQNPTVSIEGVFSRRVSNERKLIIEFLSQNTNSEILIWEPKDISTLIKQFPANSIKHFPLPQKVFSFLDTLNPKLMPDIFADTEPEQLLGLLAKRAHDLILVKENKLNLPSWQLTKLQNQVKQFSISGLVELNNQLLELDYKNKSGSLSSDLGSALEVLMVKLNNKHKP